MGAGGSRTLDGRRSPYSACRPSVQAFGMNSLRSRRPTAGYRSAWMEDLLPFDLAQLGDGRYELRAFSDDSDDPITMALDPESGQRPAASLGKALDSKEANGAVQRFEVPVGERLIIISVLLGGGMRLTFRR